MVSTTTTRERPMNVSAWEVRAIRDGRKTQTRRLVKPQPPAGAEVRIGLFHPTKIDRCGEEYPGPATFGAYSLDGEWGLKCPFGQPGDHLWGRETYGEVRFCGIHDGDLHESVTAYKADNPERKPLAWRPSTQMPRWASRIDLLIKSVRIERLQEISEADLVSEGFGPDDSPPHDGTRLTAHGRKLCFEYFWDEGNGQGSFDANPFVWVIEHERMQ